MSDRLDDAAEARKAWAQMGKYKSMFNGWMLRADYNRAVKGILSILESLARREYEAGYRDGSVKTRCCYAGSVQACPHHEARRRG